MNPAKTLTSMTAEYLAALGMSAASPTLEFLAKLQREHINRFSFNNIGVLLNEPLPLDIDSLFNKIVTRKRGGYCFEHNKLFHHILTELGYDTRIMLCRVTPELSSDGPRTHRITLVELDEQRFLADVGYGPFTPRSPVPFYYDKVFEQESLKLRIIDNSHGEHALQVIKEGEWTSLYTFDFGRYTEGDCEAGHLYSHQHADAPFRNRLLISLATRDHTRVIFNTTYRKLFSASSFEKTEIETPKQLHELLEQEFGIPTTMEEAANLLQIASKLNEALTEAPG